MFLQGSIFGSLAPACDREFVDLSRRHLDATSWVDFAPTWVTGADELFYELVDALPWRQRTDVPMYDNLVVEPRLTWWGQSHGKVDLPPILLEIQAALASRYDEPLDAISANLYRDGRDSVAWHRDRNRYDQVNPLVAIVSLGARRPFRMRPFQQSARTKTGESHVWQPGEGDLLVMGGACQHEWEHTVPKLARPTGPRISVMFRTSVDADRDPRPRRGGTSAPPGGHRSQRGSGMA